MVLRGARHGFARGSCELPPIRCGSLLRRRGAVMSSGPFRLKAGGQIDRTREIAFEFDHCAYHGFAGDTVASALLAGGVSVVGRSFKFHRPRGVLTAGLAEPNALLTVGTGGRRQPSVRSTT